MREDLETQTLDGVVVVDTETTGVAIGHDEILSIAIVDAHGEALLHTLVRPERHRQWPSAERVNGISPEMVRNAPALREVTPRVRTLINDEHLVVAYNAPFDLGMLKSLGVITGYPRQVFDVMEQYARLHGSRRTHGGGRYRWSKLVDCARHYGYAFDPHDALEDARATAYCFRALLAETNSL